MIVAGVLLALAADATWEARGDRVREQEVLADLLQEFRENEANLARDIEVNSLAHAAGQLRYEILVGGRSVSSDSLASSMCRP